MNGEIERRVTLVLDIYESSSEKGGGGQWQIVLVLKEVPVISL